MNPEDLDDNLDLKEALTELSCRAPAPPGGLDVLNAIKHRTRRRIMLGSGLTAAVCVAAFWIAQRPQNPIPPMAPTPTVCETPIKREPPFFSVVSVGEFSPGVESVLRSPSKGLSPSLPVMSMSMPNVSLTIKGK